MKLNQLFFLKFYFFFYITTLFRAVQTGNTDIVALLLNKNINIDINQKSISLKIIKYNSKKKY